MKQQYKQVRKRFPLWTRGMVLHYLAGYNGTSHENVCHTLLGELQYYFAKRDVYVTHERLQASLMRELDSKGE